MTRSFTVKIFILCSILAAGISLLTNCSGEGLPRPGAKFSALKNFSLQDSLRLTDNRQERKALKFLYKNMPVGDVLDYPASLYLQSIRIAMKAKDTFPWGKTLSDTLFQHFVLPLRVNNESLDSCRTVFYNELKQRVQWLSMYDAILEVNHWCHEKVMYSPSDARTSAPLATVRTASGRCGEESVLCVNALRSVGIPARQVYTPRWAHTDDNHAWVEAWADGRWYYFGACEPEPELNMAWFSDPATRSLLMHSKVFGKYTAKEEIIKRTPCYTEINLTQNYAPTDEVRIRVVDTLGNPVRNARVDYKIYNYAEFYPAIRQKTSDQGFSSARFGLGDILVWAAKDKSFGFKKVSVGKDTRDAQGEPALVQIVIDRQLGEAFSVDLDIVPPPGKAVTYSATPEDIELNKVLLADEDNKRQAYTDSFAPEDSISAVAAASSIEKAVVEKFLTAAKGNWKEIARFLQSLDAESLPYGIALLEQISAKDLRDTPAAVLQDHLCAYRPNPHPLYLQYVLNPRIDNELLSPWRSFFQKELKPLLADTEATDTEATDTSATVQKLHALAASIRLLDAFNPQHLCLSPEAMYRHKAGDRDGQERLFIALCRSLNIPARREEISGKVQYHAQGQWTDVSFGAPAKEKSPHAVGTLKLRYAGHPSIDDPRFETHFTLSLIDSADIRLMNFRNREGLEGSLSWSNCFGPRSLSFDSGYYLITSGTRMPDGKVLAHLSAFTLPAGQNIEEELVLRSDTTACE